MTIDFRFTPDQDHLRDSARQFLAQRCPTTVVRDLEATDAGYDPAVWREMAGLGWLGTTVPERDGGAGAEFLTLVPLYEEMGRALLPSPHLDTTVAIDLLVAAGTDAQRSQLLPPILAGDSVVSLALVEPDGGISPDSIVTRASNDGDGWILHGTKLLVAYAASSDRFVCSAATDSGVTLFLVDTVAPGVEIAPMPNLTGVPLSAVTLDGVRVPADAVVGSPGEGWPLMSDAIAKGGVLLAATIVGAARAVLDMTNQYAKDREQFGNPIGRYQAVQYLVSDILIDLHRADFLTRQAAYLISAGRPFRREAAIAAAFAKQASAHLHRQAHEVHAGVGFMMEHDLQLYSRRAKYWEVALGDAAHHEARLVDELAAV